MTNIPGAKLNSLKERIRPARVVGLDLVRDSRFMRMMAVPSGEDAGTLLHMDISYGSVNSSSVELASEHRLQGLP